MCLSLDWLEHVFIAIIVIVAVIGLLRLLASFVLPRLGLAGEVVGLVAAAVRIVIWAIVCVAVVIFIFDLVACLLPYAGMRR